MSDPTTLKVGDFLRFEAHGDVITGTYLRTEGTQIVFTVIRDQVQRAGTEGRMNIGYLVNKNRKP